MFLWYDRRMKKPDLKTLLEKVLLDYPSVKRTQADPIQFPRRFFAEKRPAEEVEAVAVYAAMLAYGSAAQFIKKIDETMRLCNWRFLELITGRNPESFAWPAYRLSTGPEIGMFAAAVGRLIKKHGSLKEIFLAGYGREENIQQGLARLQGSLVNEIALKHPVLPRGTRHLLPDPLAGGCAKRWHMMLRWLVRRDDGVDMGLWHEVNPAGLLMPLDRHISRIARNLGLTARNTDDWKTAAEITARLREFSPDDPVKYDFALCHLGIAGECTHGKDQKLCSQCLLSSVCRAARPPAEK